jgi:NAD-dependent deacetylase
MKEIKALAKEFLELILSSKHSVAFTGAGISTESGIPDYRSPGTGVWERMDQSVVSLEGFYRSPEKYYRYALEMDEIRSKAKPNAAHRLLAELEARGLLLGVITQNVDGLHQSAGSQRVYELHGSLREAECLTCGSLFPMDGVMERVRGGEIPPACTECGSRLLKPRAVFFGEALPQETWHGAMRLVKGCDLLIVIGSSLLVSPANILPEVALTSGAKLVIINLMPTPYDGRATLTVGERVGEFAEEVLCLLAAMGRQ